MANFGVYLQGARRVCGFNLLHTYRSVAQRSCWRALSSTATQANGDKQPPESDEGAKQEESTTTQEIAKLEETFKEERERLQVQVEDFTDKYKRSLAEMENLRQRMQKQINDSKLFGIQGFCKDLLEVADILGKATESVPKEKLEQNGDLKNLYEGLMMTDGQLSKVFTRHGLLQINPPEGEKFDPHIHEALFQMSVEGKEAGTVASVTKIGYKLHDRTIRPALVGVFK